MANRIEQKETNIFLFILSFLSILANTEES